MYVNNFIVLGIIYIFFLYGDQSRLKYFWGLLHPACNSKWFWKQSLHGRWPICSAFWLVSSNCDVNKQYTTEFRMFPHSMKLTLK